LKKSFGLARIQADLGQVEVDDKRRLAMRGAVFLIVLGSGAFLLGLAYVIWISVIKRQGSGVANWPHVTGVVTQSVVTALDRETPSGVQRTFTPLIVYTYQVGEQAYVSQKRNVLPATTATFEMPAKADAVVARYPAGATVDVFYNPANPKQAVLEAPRPAAHNAVLFFGLANLVLGAAIIALGVVLL